MTSWNNFFLKINKGLINSGFSSLPFLLPWILKYMGPCAQWWEAQGLRNCSVVLYLHSQHPNLLPYSTRPANWNSLICHLTLTSVFYSYAFYNSNWIFIINNITAHQMLENIEGKCDINPSLLPFPKSMFSSLFPFYKCMSHFILFFFFFFFRWRFVPLSRWVQLRLTTTSLWTSLVPVVLLLCQATWTQQAWEQEWHLPAWAGRPWAWTSLGLLEWAPSAPTGRGCLSRPIQAHGPSLCLFRA